MIFCFIPILPLVFSVQFTLSLHFTPGLQSTVRSLRFTTDWFAISPSQLYHALCLLNNSVLMLVSSFTELTIIWNDSRDLWEEKMIALQ